MSIQTTSRPVPQPGAFKFGKNAMDQADKILARYPEDRKASGILPLLDVAQRENGGWLSREAQDYVALLCDVAPIRVYEVASFYTMYYTNKVGKHVVQVCRTTPCWLNGSDKLTQCAKKKLNLGLGESSADGNFTLIEVECLGACANAPMVQINDDYFEDLTPDQFEKVLDDLANGKKPKIGSQTKRKSSEPVNGGSTLLDFDGSDNRTKKLAAFTPPEQN